MPIKVITDLSDIPSDVRTWIVGLVDSTVELVTDMKDEDKKIVREKFDADLDNGFKFALVGSILMDFAMRIKKIDENEEYKIVG